MPLRTILRRLSRDGKDDRSRRFDDQLARLQEIRDPANMGRASADALDELEILAHKHSIPYLHVGDARIAELSKLPLREIEAELKIKRDDEAFGRTAYVHVYPRANPETAEAAKQRENSYKKAMAKLFRRTPKPA